MGGGGQPTPSYIPQAAAPVAVQAEAVQAKKSIHGFQGSNQSILAASNQAGDVRTGSLGLNDDAKFKRKNLLGG